MPAEDDDTAGHKIDCKECLFSVGDFSISIKNAPVKLGASSTTDFWAGADEGT